MKTVEIEQKFRLENPARLRRMLRALGARKIRSGTEDNEFFDCEGRLLRKKTILRLRRVKDKATLTLKGKKVRRKYTHRLEIETPVSYHEARALLRKMGYQSVARYSKKREEYCAGACMVTVDYFPGFGWFSEIEGSPRDIARLATKMGLRDCDREERSYLQMLWAKKNHTHKGTQVPL